MLNGFLNIFPALLTLFLVFMIFQAVGGRIPGGKVEAVSLFLGPTIFWFQIGGISFRLNLIPLGSFVKFADEFSLLHPLRKILIVLAGLTSYLLLGFVGLGVEETFRQFASGFGQIVFGALSPFEVGGRSILKLAEIFRDKSFFAGLGVLSAKALAFNLLPLGTQAGGMIVLYLLELAGVKSEKVAVRFQAAGLVLVLIVGLAWLLAFVRAALNIW